MAHRWCLHALTRHATALVSLNTPINPPFSAAVSFKTVTTSQLDTRTHWSVSRRFSSSKSDDEKEESRGESSNGEEIDDDNTDYQFRSSENLPGNDPSFGRRMSGGDHNWKSKVVLLHGLKNDSGKLSSFKGAYVVKKHTWFRKHVRSIACIFVLMGFFFFLDSLMVSIFDSINLHNTSTSKNSKGLKAKDDTVAYINKEKPPIKMYVRLLNLASGALAEKEFKQEKSDFWEEPYQQASVWKPCADRRTPNLWKPKESNGYILVSANGGLNQQRVAICNAVALASLLNSTLVLPRFLYSNVWKDPSLLAYFILTPCCFNGTAVSLVISTKEHFMNMLKDEINIIKELPPYMKSIDIEAIGSLITDADFMKEATPIDYVKKVLPFLVRNGIVHFLGFGNRLGFDPLPYELQRLRCKCNFHALKFVPKIQQAGALLVRRIRKYDSERSMLDKQLLGNFIPNFPSEHQNIARGLSSYLALHLRFEEDMVAYSQCDFGGGKDEQKELQAYREIHFPLLTECLKISKPISPMELRKLRRCPLTPEEVALLLSGLGFKGGTYIYLAGSSIYIWRKITDASVHEPLSEFGHQANTPYVHRMNSNLLEIFHLRWQHWIL
ncbi:hypothetical protein Q3G72_007133 [Acer saccharum]|nr:hypothetical protein Q3G72_007133 [Acer saccharum]